MTTVRTVGGGAYVSALTSAYGDQTVVAIDPRSSSPASSWRFPALSGGRLDPVRSADRLGDLVVARAARRRARPGRALVAGAPATAAGWLAQPSRATRGCSAGARGLSAGARGLGAGAPGCAVGRRGGAGDPSAAGRSRGRGSRGARAVRSDGCPSARRRDGTGLGYPQRIELNWTVADSLPRRGRRGLLLRTKDDTVAVGALDASEQAVQLRGLWYYVLADGALIARAAGPPSTPGALAQRRVDRVPLGDQYQAGWLGATAPSPVRVP